MLLNGDERELDFQGLKEMGDTDAVGVDHCPFNPKTMTFGAVVEIREPPVPELPG